MSLLPNLASNWKKLPLGEVCEIIMGQAPKGTSYNDNGIGTPLIAGAADLGVKTPERAVIQTNIHLPIADRRSANATDAVGRFAVKLNRAAITASTPDGAIGFLGIPRFQTSKRATADTRPGRVGDPICVCGRHHAVISVGVSGRDPLAGS